MHGAQIPNQGGHGAIPTFDPARQRPVMPSSMELVVNAIDHPVGFEIGGFPGSPAMTFRLQPGDQAYLPETYCRPIEGANPNTPRPSVLAMVASVEPYPGGTQIQAVVPLRDAAATRARWDRARAEAPRTSVVMLQDSEGRAVSLAIPKNIPAPPRRRDEDDEDDVIEPPPPGVADLRATPPGAEPATAAPAAPSAKTVGDAPRKNTRKAEGEG